MIILERAGLTHIFPEPAIANVGAWVVDPVEAAAVESAAAIRERAGQLAGVKPDAPDRAERLQAFAATFAERAFCRPLDAPVQALVAHPFVAAPDVDAALERSLLLVLSSPAL